MCVEGNDDRNRTDSSGMADGASTEDRLDSQLKNGESVTYQNTGGFPNTPPGININPALLNASAAELASTLMHEAAHARDRTLNPGSPEDERIAYEAEAPFICCATSYLINVKPVGWEAARAALCVRLLTVNVLYCRNGGTQALQCSGCILPPFLCGTTPPIPPQPVIPRDPINPAQLSPTTAIYGISAGMFRASLQPIGKSLYIVHSPDQQAGQWTLDISSQSEGTFQPLVMLRGDKAELYVAGRITESEQTAVYRFDVIWNGHNPSLSAARIYLGTELGDITAIAYTKPMNGALAVFDHTNARVSYLNISTGNVQHVASYQNYPELLDMFGMVVNWTQRNPAIGRPAGVWLVLQPQQDVEIAESPDVVSVNIVDDNAGGTVDEFFVR